MNHGYIQRPHLPGHKVFGSANQIGGTPLTNGHWLPYIPAQDVQQNIGVEPECCTSCGTIDGVSTIARFLFQDATEWSYRLLAYLSGTTEQGNDPMTVAQALATKGTVPENNWPNTSALTTWADFYTTPSQDIITKALEFCAQYAFDAEWVNTDTASLLAALPYSPVGVAVYAWQQDPTTGYYINPTNQPPCHWVLLVDYDENNYWVIFDSYEQDIKRLAWDFPFAEAMRYSLTKNVGNTPAEQSAWQQFLAFMQSILGL